MRQIIIFFVALLLLNCKQKQNEKKTSQQKENKEFVKDSVFSIKINEIEIKYPCGEVVGYGFLGWHDKDALIDEVEELLLNLCKNNNGEYALSVESTEVWSDGKLKRGKIYDYKRLGIIEGEVSMGEGCVLPTGETLASIVIDNSVIHSIWRVKEGKLIEMDKNKEYPCVDFDEGME